MSTGSGTIAAAVAPTSGYATLADLSDWTGTAVGSLPSDASRLLLRASEMVDYATLNRISTSNTSQMAIAKSAVCAQVEYWQEQGEDTAYRPAVKGYGIGKVSMQFSQGETQLAPRARILLQTTGMMNRSARAACAPQISSTAAEFFDL